MFGSYTHHSNISIIKTERFPLVLVAIFSVDPCPARWFAQELPIPGYMNKHTLSHEKCSGIKKGAAYNELSPSLFTSVTHSTDEYACRLQI
jgi:hypothetical protein